MKSSADWYEEKYRETFESNLAGLERRRANDPTFTLEDAKGTLSHLYIQEGNDWEGRGELQNRILAATVAAYEHFIAEWRAVAERRSPEEE